MAEVFHLALHRTIPPKSETYEHAGQKYTCTFDPNAPDHARWVWRVDFVRTYLYFGSAPTLEGASKSARKHIHALVKGTIEEEENE